MNIRNPVGDTGLDSGTGCHSSVASHIRDLQQLLGLYTHEPTCCRYIQPIAIPWPFQQYEERSGLCCPDPGIPPSPRDAHVQLTGFSLAFWCNPRKHSAEGGQLPICSGIRCSKWCLLTRSHEILEFNTLSSVDDGICRWSTPLCLIPCHSVNTNRDST